MNKFKDENVKLKTKIQQSNKEIEKKEKIIQGLMYQMNADPGQAKNQYFEPPIVLSLKRKLKELREEQIAKETESESLKSSVKINHFKELDNELKENETECARLKSIVVELMNNQGNIISPKDVAELEDNLTQQEAMIKNINHQNQVLVQSMQEKEEEIIKMKDLSSKLEKRIGKAEIINKEDLKNKNIFEENLKEIKKLKEQVEIYKVDNKEHEAISLKRKINELSKKQTELNTMIKANNERIENLKQNTNKKPGVNNNYNELSELKAKIEDCII